MADKKQKNTDVCFDKKKTSVTLMSKVSSEVGKIQEYIGQSIV